MLAARLSIGPRACKRGDRDGAECKNGGCPHAEMNHGECVSPRQVQVALLATNPNPNPNPNLTLTLTLTLTKVSAWRLARDEERGVEAHAELADEVGLARSGAEGLGELLGAWLGSGFGFGFGFGLAPEPTASVNVLVSGKHGAARIAVARTGMMRMAIARIAIASGQYEALCAGRHITPTPTPTPYPLEHRTVRSCRGYSSGRRGSCRCRCPRW